MKHCQIEGIASSAFCPNTLGTVGTSRHPKNSIPSLITIVSSIFLTRLRKCSSLGINNIPTPNLPSNGNGNSLIVFLK